MVTDEAIGIADDDRSLAIEIEQRRGGEFILQVRPPSRRAIVGSDVASCGDGPNRPTSEGRVAAVDRDERGRFGGGGGDQLEGVRECHEIAVQSG